ncbi:MAG: response regulator [Deltaproteobacteria bacterium]|jgi:signal transduction histidine kinase/ActR/RegA family two-component response regulator/HPt (histidine-containing phosphotransfer) domain-containing protein|nr:response regulator [Deltaproteobacteria bacterium]
MSFRNAIKNDYKLIILVIMAFLIMSLASYFFMSRVVRRQIDLYSQTEMRVYRQGLLSLSQACEDALLHSSQVMTMGMERGVKELGYLDLVRRLSNDFSYQSNLRQVYQELFCYLDGNYIDVGGIKSLPESEMEKLDWYAGAIDWAKGGEGPSHFYHSGPYNDRQTGKSVVALSKPITDGKGTIRGVMGMEFDLDPVIARVEGLKLGRGEVFALLADSKLKIVAFSDHEAEGKHLHEIDSFKNLVSELPATSSDMLIRRIYFDGKFFVAIFSRLENGWVLGMLSPESFYYQEARDTFPVLFGIALFLATMLSIVLIRLSQARARSEEANRLKTNSLARISHELRTPLNAIIGLSELVRRNPLAPNVPSYLEDINRAGGSLLNLVNEILDFSKLESGKIELTESPYKTGRLLGDVLALVAVRLKDKPFLEFKTDISQDIPGVLLGDERSVKQVLLNLLVNAVKYTNKGHIKFSASFEKLDSSSIELIFTVEDTGVGIRDEDLEHLFDDFVRLEGRANQKVEGTGLGLSIALNLCRLMDGDITVQSVFGQGSTFTATCRQAIVDPRPLGQLPSRTDASGVNATVPFLAPDFKVLLVDDVLTNLTVAKGLLEPYRMRLTTALSGQEAVELAKAQAFDLLFIDQMMPVLDGVETLKLIRAISGHYLRVPIVSLTANAVTGARESLLEQGFDDYISKPIDNDEMTALLEKWIPPEARMPPEEAFPGLPEMAGLDGSATVLDKVNPSVETGHLVGQVMWTHGENDHGRDDTGHDDTGHDDQGNLGLSGEAGENAKAEFLAKLTLEGFEPADGLRRSGESVPKFRELLGAFLLDAASIGAGLGRELAAPMDPKELGDLGIRVHALKSASANIGAKRLSRMAANLEEAAKNGRMEPFTDGELGVFKKELDLVAAKIDSALKFSQISEAAGQGAGQGLSQGAPLAGPGQVGEKPSAERLGQLKRALEKRDVGLADRLIEELSSKCDLETKTLLAAASDQILIADYGAALDLIGRI